jgi:hypothetical protein
VDVVYGAEGLGVVFGVVGGEDFDVGEAELGGGGVSVCCERLERTVKGEG